MTEEANPTQLAPIGLIAGGGDLPALVAKNARAAGRKVIGVGLRDQYENDLPQLCDEFKTAGIIQIGRWIRLLKKAGASEAILVGNVKKVRMYDPFLLFRQLPDWRAARVWYVTTKYDKRTDTLLGAVADEMSSEGVHLIDSTSYIPESMADEGVMTSRKPTPAIESDITFGMPIVRQMGGLDIGQSIAVKDRDVIAVEAIEGTDRMIERAGSLCRAGKWTLIKVSKPDQDMRFDVPTIGAKTIDNIKAAGGACVVVEAGKTIILDKEATLKHADKQGIVVVGVKFEDE